MHHESRRIADVGVDVGVDVGAASWRLSQSGDQQVAMIAVATGRCAAASALRPSPDWRIPY